MKKHYYVEFSNSVKHLYYLIFNEGGELIDSIFRSREKDVYALEDMKKKYGNLIKLSKFPITLSLPILNETEEIQEVLDKWSEKWSNAAPMPDDTPVHSATLSKKLQPTEDLPVLSFHNHSRFVVYEDSTGEKFKVMEGIRWTNGSITTVTGDFHRSYLGWTEFYEQCIKPHIWKYGFQWIDDERKSKDMAHKLVGVAKEAQALSKLVSNLVDTLTSDK